MPTRPSEQPSISSKNSGNEDSSAKPDRLRIPILDVFNRSIKKVHPRINLRHPDVPSETP